jgi:hypothetical protein
MDKIIINNLIETNKKLVIENEDLKCMNLLLNLKIDSLQRDKELYCLRDILELNKKILNNYLEIKNLYTDLDFLFLETDKIIEEINKFNEKGELKK